MIDISNTPEKLLKDSAFVIKEVEQQPEKWIETFEIVKKHKNELKRFLKPEYDVIFTGAGTSEYIGGTIFRELNQKEDRHYETIGSPDIVTHPHYYFKKNKKTILVNFSRGGMSPETFGTIEHADAIIDDVKHLFIVCNPEGGLIEYNKQHPEKSYCLIMPEGTYDQSFAMTSSYTCMALAAYLCFNLDNLDELEETVRETAKCGQEILEKYATPLKELVHATPFDKFNFLGSCNLKYFAKEADIKVLEVSAGRPGTWYDSIPGFRHGPIVTIRSGANILTVVCYENDDYVNQYADDMIEEIANERMSFSKTIAITPRHTEVSRNMADLEVYVNNQKLSSVFLALPYAIVIHMIMLYRGWEYGISSDSPFGKGAHRGIQTKVYPIK
ncbi:MAG: hypothetical protein IKG35_06170 [Erysipelotrichaceae bacterium]|nr:hypothetical protein [Erysipelotrichaceae bacterium]